MITAMKYSTLALEGLSMRRLLQEARDAQAVFLTPKGIIRHVVPYSLAEIKKSLGIKRKATPAEEVNGAPQPAVKRKRGGG